MGAASWSGASGSGRGSGSVCCASGEARQIGTGSVCGALNGRVRVSAGGHLASGHVACLGRGLWSVSDACGGLSSGRVSSLYACPSSDPVACPCPLNAPASCLYLCPWSDRASYVLTDLSCSPSCRHRRWVCLWIGRAAYASPLRQSDHACAPPTCLAVGPGMGHAAVLSTCPLTCSCACLESDRACCP